MSCGVPCFSTDVGDVRKIIYNKNWVVDIDNMKQLSDVCLDYFKKNYKERNLIQKLIKWTHNNFDSDKVLTKYVTMYQNLNQFKNF